jgi:hypothetical protein
MRLKRLAVAVVAVAVVATAALATVPLATAATMHPEFGARLSGMGEHGIVNLKAHAKQHRLCWKFELTTMHVLRATIRDRHGMIVARLGHMYRATGCAMIAKRALRLIESKPGRYWVWVATKGHPGELRGRLHAGMVHM